MPCNRNSLHLLELFTGTLDAAARADLETHLPSCSDCSARLRDWKAIQSAAGSVPLPTNESFWIQQRHHIMEKITAPPAPGWRLRWVGPVVLAGVMAGLFWLRPTSRDDVAVAQQVGFLQDMELMKDLDVLEAWDGKTHA